MSNAADRMAFNLKLMRIIAAIDFPAFDFVVIIKNDLFFIQVECLATCNTTGKAYLWKGRKWFVSEHSTDSEIVQTCFKAVLTGLEHEAREQFKFHGQPVFRPHFDVYELHGLSEDDKTDVRIEDKKLEELWNKTLRSEKETEPTIADRYVWPRL